jgi:hypothetical protein
VQNMLPSRGFGWDHPLPGSAGAGEQRRFGR